MRERESEKRERERVGEREKRVCFNLKCFVSIVSESVILFDFGVKRLGGTKF